MIPNCLQDVEDIKAAYPQEWADAHTGNANTEAFIRKLALRLHTKDSRFGLNGKRGDPLDISDDALCFKGEGPDWVDSNGIPMPASVIDVIGAAGSPSAKPTWVIVSNPNAPIKTAWVSPVTVHPPPPPPPTIPSYEQLGGDTFFRAMIGVPLQADYLTAGQQLNDGSAVWFSRAIYRLMAAFLKANGQPIDAAGEVKIVRNEWRQVLGLPVLP